MIFLILHMSSNGSLSITSADDTLIDESTQMTPFPKPFLTEEQWEWSVVMSMRLEEENDRRLQAEEYKRHLLYMEESAGERAACHTPMPPHFPSLLQVIDITMPPAGSPPHSPFPPPLIREENKEVIFPDRESYLTAPVAYLIGLIEGLPSTEFVSGPT
ncbi:hypothetical protein HETIRDRAFT_121142 [Heterobasidion irregulare TC 32-1]|uniref:Uncharacterized protein n=1 Tax=Heterobasidion irregulare (strain TC 32-1) TaxID=747525 RepID=W4KIF8_HETIT|nr:uncharacterized protein HETIRDRAFT_121142 [Heterobasidion irregulare TC 32-1]ETW84826.1 hypothetical protein HETIRDRAFT_121142 [Heterobasidion irregulare TC 32-1]